ncbi:MAG: hypothetical protein Q9217_003180 [Psora testacea]
MHTISILALLPFFTAALAHSHKPPPNSSTDSHTGEANPTLRFVSIFLATQTAIPISTLSSPFKDFRHALETGATDPFLPLITALPKELQTYASELAKIAVEPQGGDKEEQDASTSKTGGKGKETNTADDDHHKSPKANHSTAVSTIITSASASASASALRSSSGVPANSANNTLGSPTTTASASGAAGQPIPPNSTPVAPAPSNTASKAVVGWCVIGLGALVVVMALL